MSNVKKELVLARSTLSGDKTLPFVSIDDAAKDLVEVGCFVFYKVGSSEVVTDAVAAAALTISPAGVVSEIEKAHPGADNPVNRATLTVASFEMIVRAPFTGLTDVVGKTVYATKAADAANKVPAGVATATAAAGLATNSIFLSDSFDALDPVTGKYVSCVKIRLIP